MVFRLKYKKKIWPRTDMEVKDKAHFGSLFINANIFCTYLLKLDRWQFLKVSFNVES